MIRNFLHKIWCGAQLEYVNTMTKVPVIIKHILLGFKKVEIKVSYCRSCGFNNGTWKEV